MKPPAGKFHLSMVFVTTFQCCSSQYQIGDDIRNSVKENARLRQENEFLMQELHVLRSSQDAQTIPRINGIVHTNAEQKNVGSPKRPITPRKGQQQSNSHDSPGPRRKREREQADASHSKP